MKLKALVTAELIKEEIEKLNSQIDFDYIGYGVDHIVIPQEELKERIKDYDILICEYDTLDRNVLSNAKKLKLIICCRGGVDSVIDLNYCKEAGICVANNKGRNAYSVAEMVIAFMINMTRNITITNSLIHNRVITSKVSTMPKEYNDTVWGIDDNSPFIQYRGKNLRYLTLGLCGFGYVGLEVYKLASSFGMNIITYDPYFNSHNTNVSFVSFEELIERSDIVSVHCPVTKNNKGMFNRDVFNKMKKGSYFINTSRGELVNEGDLIEALKSGQIAQAALDVFDEEPIGDDSPLLECDNLIMTPHICGSSLDVQIHGTQLTIETLNYFLSGKKPVYAVVWSDK